MSYGETLFAVLLLNMWQRRRSCYFASFLCFASGYTSNSLREKKTPSIAEGFIFPFSKSKHIRQSPPPREMSSSILSVFSIFFSRLILSHIPFSFSLIWQTGKRTIISNSFFCFFCVWGGKQDDRHVSFQPVLFHLAWKVWRPTFKWNGILARGTNKTPCVTHFLVWEGGRGLLEEEFFVKEFRDHLSGKSSVMGR